MEGIASLGISLPTLLAQIVNFVILFGLLYLVAYKPVMRMLDERSKRTRESMEQAEYIKEDQGEYGAGRIY
jgi:F-type H+-transporting ATPase subunit b